MKASAPHGGRGRYNSVAEILANAHLTEDPARLLLHKLELEKLAQVVISKSMGIRPIRCTWPDGVSSLMPIADGKLLPDSTLVVRAYLTATAAERGECSGGWPCSLI